MEVTLRVYTPLVAHPWSARSAQSVTGDGGEHGSEDVVVASSELVVVASSELVVVASSEAVVVASPEMAVVV